MNYNRIYDIQVLHIPSNLWLWNDDNLGVAVYILS